MMQHGFLRHGVMCAFETFEDFRSSYEEVINLFRDDSEDSDEDKSYAEIDGSFNYRNLVGTPSSYEEISSPTRPFTELARNYKDMVKYLFCMDFSQIFNKLNKASTGPRSVARFKPEVHPRSKLMKCPEEQQQ